VSWGLSVVEQQAEALIASGVKGAFICGTTGEESSMTTAERMAVAEAWDGCDARGGRIFSRLVASIFRVCTASSSRTAI
jgi:N-acetylneuraminate lyase